MQTAWILAIGTELTLGQSIDTNSAWLARQLAEIGIRATRHVTLPDELAPLVQVIQRGAAAVDVVVITGGLGPTEDDLTRQALADAAGVALELDPISLRRLEVFFEARNRTLSEANRIQAFVPQGGRAIENLRGTAPGLYHEVTGTPVYVMPGVPVEMKTMFERFIRPELAVAARGGVLRSRKLNTIGIPESELNVRIKDLMQRGRNPEVGTTADLGTVGVRINASGGSAAAADALLDEIEARVRERLGRSVFSVGEDDIAAAVGKLLADRQMSVCTAESCTGGLIGKWLTDAAGSSAYFRGGAITYSNESKTGVVGVPADLIRSRGAVSSEVATQMARGARRVFEADYALSVTGIAGPGGGSPEKPVGLVFIGVAGPDREAVRELRLGSDSFREDIRVRAGRAALALLRDELLDSADVT